jgi:hypothetical protein
MAKHDRKRARSALVVALLLVVTIIGGMMVAATAGAQTVVPGDQYTTVSPSTEITTTVPPSVRSKCPLQSPLGPNCDPTTIPPPPPPPCIGGNCLPITGADLTLFIATGLAAIATGVALVRRTRSRRERLEPEASSG